MKKYQEKYAWVRFSQNYLNLAKLGCQEILSPKHKRIQFRTKLEGDYKAEDLFVSIFYNIKHGIEIFIKTFKIILSEKLNKDDLRHNIPELFQLFQRELARHKISEFIATEYQKNPEDIILQSAYQDKDRISDVLINLEKLIVKYYHCEILHTKLNDNFQIEDIDNTVFRYPENNMKIKINYNKILKSISQKDIEEINEDIKKLLDNFNGLGFILDIYKTYIKK